MKKIEIKFGLIILAIAVFFYAASSSLPEEAGYYPKFVGMLSILLATIYLIQTAKNENNEKSTFAGINWNQLLLVLGLSLVYTVLMKPVGYFMSTFIYLVISLIGLRISPKNAILVAFGTGIFMFIVFRTFLSVPLPMGMFY